MMAQSFSILFIYFLVLFNSCDLKEKNFIVEEKYSGHTAVFFDYKKAKESPNPNYYFINNDGIYYTNEKFEEGSVIQKFFRKKGNELIILNDITGISISDTSLNVINNNRVLGFKVNGTREIVCIAFYVGMKDSSYRKTEFDFENKLLNIVKNKY